jgi:hypothetical protein
VEAAVPFGLPLGLRQRLDPGHERAEDHRLIAVGAVELPVQGWLALSRVRRLPHDSLTCGRAFSLSLTFASRVGYVVPVSYSRGCRAAGNRTARTDLRRNEKQVQSCGYLGDPRHACKCAAKEERSVSSEGKGRQAPDWRSWLMLGLSGEDRPATWSSEHVTLLPWWQAGPPVHGHPVGCFPGWRVIRQGGG